RSLKEISAIATKTHCNLKEKYPELLGNKLTINDPKVDKDNDTGCQSKCEHDWIGKPDMGKLGFLRDEYICSKCQAIKLNEWILDPFDFKENKHSQFENQECTCIDKIIDALMSTVKEFKYEGAQLDKFLQKFKESKNNGIDKNK
ncbi:MAG: hypothetical protein M1308_14035, partial [Actinobacteria bacterium]|nr:hypothetical protein [Actinomycetota bacterium]